MTEQAPQVDLDALAEALAAGATLVDVRGADEYAQARIAGARLVPLDELQARVDEIPKGERVYVICAMGGRSLAAATALNQAGWDCVSVAGGTKQWVDEGRPFLTGP
jgi:rhodanese-related sulfurtransferase